MDPLLPSSMLLPSALSKALLSCSTRRDGCHLTGYGLVLVEEPSPDKPFDIPLLLDMCGGGFKLT